MMDLVLDQYPFLRFIRLWRFVLNRYLYKWPCNIKKESFLMIINKKNPKNPSLKSYQLIHVLVTGNVRHVNVEMQQLLP